MNIISELIKNVIRWKQEAEKQLESANSEEESYEYIGRITICNRVLETLHDLNKGEANDKH